MGLSLSTSLERCRSLFLHEKNLALTSNFFLGIVGSEYQNLTDKNRVPQTRETNQKSHLEKSSIQLPKMSDAQANEAEKNVSLFVSSFPMAPLSILLVALGASGCPAFGESQSTSPNKIPLLSHL